MLVLDFHGLNGWAITLLIVAVLGLAALPFMWGKPRTPYGWGTILTQVLEIVLLLLALNACRIGG